MVAVTLLTVEVLLVKNVSDRSAIKTRERSYLLAITVFAIRVLLDGTTLMLSRITWSSTGRLL